MDTVFPPIESSVSSRLVRAPGGGVKQNMYRMRPRHLETGCLLSYENFVPSLSMLRCKKRTLGKIEAEIDV